MKFDSVRLDPVRLVSGLALLLTIAISPAAASEPAASPEQILETFSSHWKESDWTSPSRSRSRGYMRPLDDEGWQVRMQSIQDLVSQGKKSVPVLLKALKSKNDALRILAAQTLGYLAADIPEAPLLEAARNDKNPSVRLYAVDVLGMQSTTGKIDWQAIRKNEKNRDVRKHIGYAVERKDEGVQQAVVDTLTQWDFQSINTATVGKKAPDFELTAATGQKVRLSDYQGKQAVVLVFIYGDT